jgi:hypothetical protein
MFSAGWSAIATGKSPSAKCFPAGCNDHRQSQYGPLGLLFLRWFFLRYRVIKPRRQRRRRSHADQHHPDRPSGPSSQPSTVVPPHRKSPSVSLQVPAALRGARPSRATLDEDRARTHVKRVLSVGDPRLSIAADGIVPRTSCYNYLVHRQAEGAGSLSTGCRHRVAVRLGGPAVAYGSAVNKGGRICRLPPSRRRWLAFYRVSAPRRRTARRPSRRLRLGGKRGRAYLSLSAKPQALARFPPGIGTASPHGSEAQPSPTARR